MFVLERNPQIFLRWFMKQKKKLIMESEWEADLDERVIAEITHRLHSPPRKRKRATIDYSSNAHQSVFLDIKWLVLLSWFIACVWPLSIPKTNCILNSELKRCFFFLFIYSEHAARAGSWFYNDHHEFYVSFALMFFYGRSSRAADSDSYSALATIEGHLIRKSY